MKFSKTIATLLLGASSIAALASSARAADAVATEAPAAGFNWSGVYVGFGGGVGAVVRGTEVVAPGGSPTQGLMDLGGDGVFAEVSAGYDYLVSERVLVGGFIDAHAGNIAFSVENMLGGGELSLKNKYGFDVAARAGYLLTPTTLGYVLGGYTWQHIELDAPGAVPFDTDKNRSGYVLGVGMETAISGNWTLKSEYRYANYGNNIAIENLGGGALKFEPTTHTFHIGANYRFGAQNGGGTSFAAPAYSWTGFYVGGALGAGAIVDELKDPSGTTSIHGIGGEGLFGELNVGYDQEFNGIWVAGLQLGGRYSGMTTQLFDASAFGGPKYEGKADYGFDLLARVGAKLNETTLAYALGGYSWQHVEEKMSVPGLSETRDWSVNGFSVGGGLETAVSNNVSVNLEYRYSQYNGHDNEDGSETIPAFHTVRVGAKYKFN
ncbi:MAG: outer membrane beta-barrel protein [Proteobacteria bacterium]|nr:outer membrane beta-barrel protein [Pseudomonadota bacterium]